MPRFLILTVVAVAVLGVAACGDDDDGATTPTPSGDTSITGSPSASPAGSPTRFPNVCLPNPDPATDAFQVLHNPQPSSEVTSPLIVTGEVNYFEATVQIAIYDADGTPLVEVFGTAQQPDMGVLGPFVRGVEFTVAEPTPVCLWVYEQSAQDGSPIHVGQVPLVLLP